MLMLFIRKQKLAIEKWPHAEGEIMELFIRFWRGSLNRVVVVGMLLLMIAGLGGVVAVRNLTSVHAATSSCQLQSARGNIQHVIYMQFDNTHFTRDKQIGRASCRER